MQRAFPMMTGIEPEERVELAEEFAYRWLWRTEVVQEAFAAHPGPKLLVRYESLRAEPAGELAQITDWLSLPAARDQLATWTDRHAFEHQPVTGELEFVRAAEPGHWRRSLTSDERHAVCSVLGTKLRELGYEASQPDD